MSLCGVAHCEESHQLLALLQKLQVHDKKKSTVGSQQSDPDWPCWALCWHHPGKNYQLGIPVNLSIWCTFQHLEIYGKKKLSVWPSIHTIVPDCSSGVLSRSEQRTSGIAVTCKTNYYLPSVVDHLTVKHKTCDIAHLHPPSFEYIKLRRSGVMFASCGQIGLKHGSWRYTFNIRKRLKVKVVVTVDLNKEAY